MYILYSTTSLHILFVHVHTRIVLYVHSTEVSDIPLFLQSILSKLINHRQVYGERKEKKEEI